MLEASTAVVVRRAGSSTEAEVGTMTAETGVTGVVATTTGVDVSIQAAAAVTVTVRVPVTAI